MASPAPTKIAIIPPKRRISGDRGRRAMGGPSWKARRGPSSEPGSSTPPSAALPLPPPMADRVLSPAPEGDDDRFDRLFRPNSLDEYIGQAKHKDNLKVFVEAARRRREPLDHILFCGPPGLGKTTLAHILAQEMGVTLHSTA